MTRFRRPIHSDPEQPFTVIIDLINDGQIFVASLPQNLIDSDRGDLRETAMRQSPFDDPFH